MNTQQRKSYTSLGKIYFWTATIHKWYTLLQDDKMKDIIIDYLKILSGEHKIVIYGFVIMPNHLHFMWQQNRPELNSINQFLQRRISRLYLIGQQIHGNRAGIIFFTEVRHLDPSKIFSIHSELQPLLKPHT